MQINTLTVGPIIGDTTGSTVRLWGRGEMEITQSGPRRCFGIVRLWQADQTPNGAPKYFKMNPNFDMTGISIFNNLSPETNYKYQMGWFFSELELDEVSNSQVLEPDWANIPTYEFTSASTRKNKQRSFVFGSCRYLLRLFGGLWTDSRGDKTFKSILSQIKDDGIRTDNILMLGDQIYADDLNFLHAAETIDEYNARYQAAFSQPNIRQLMSQVSTYMTLDDHEIEDNWPANSSGEDWIRKYPVAIHAYQSYQMSHSPVFEIEGDRIKGTPNHFWYTFQNGCCDFFITDTRTERFLVEEENEREIISREQMRNLKSWLNDGSGRVKFLVSSVPIFPGTKFDDRDKWGGFPSQQSELLDFIWQNKIPRVVFLSGDVHSSLTAELVQQGDNSGFKVISVVSSAYYWPYPHSPRGIFDLEGNINSNLSDNDYKVVNPGEVHETDNFTRITASLTRMKVEVFERKGDRLSSRTFNF